MAQLDTKKQIEVFHKRDIKMKKKPRVEMPFCKSKTKRRKKKNLEFEIGKKLNNND